MDIEEIEELMAENAGICTKCGAINYGFHEPDARDYPCDECGANASMGIEEALLEGLVG